MPLGPYTDSGRLSRLFNALRGGLIPRPLPQPRSKFSQIYFWRNQGKSKGYKRKNLVFQNLAPRCLGLDRNKLTNSF
jgi:hypothetical protein